MASDAHDALSSLYDVLNVEAVPDVNAEAILTWLQELGCSHVRIASALASGAASGCSAS